MMKTSIALPVVAFASLALCSLLECGGGQSDRGTQGLFEGLVEQKDLYPYRMRLTRNLIVDSCPVFVQGGKSIVYAAEMEMEVEDNGLFRKRKTLCSQLFLLDLETGEKRKLSEEGWYDQFPKPSWSGDKVTFQSRQKNTDSPAELFCLDLTSGRRSGLANYAVSGTTPAFAPGDSICVFISGGEGICLLDLPSGRKRSIYYRSGLFRWRRLPELPDMPSLSADGKRIVFESGFPRKRVFAMDSDGHNIRLLTPHEENCFHPTFSPNGERILFVSDYGGADNLYLLSPSDMSIVQITFDDDDKAYPSFSPDGAKIVFSSKPQESDDYYYDIFIISNEPLDLSPAMEDFQASAENKQT
jgi:Tol biopolymer transport system component